MTDRQYLIPTTPGMGRALVNHDERSKNFRAVSLLPEAAAPRTRFWRRGRAYDQGQTSQCVAYTGKGMLNTLPKSKDEKYRIRSKYSTDQFYAGAQLNDEWDGQAYDGTSGLGLCRYLLLRGLIQEYRWCFGLEDVLRTASHVGPVGLGIYWYSSMFYPDPDGTLVIAGNRVGGHEVEITGVDTKNKRVLIMNSWGVEWGQFGEAWLPWDSLDRLLNEQGDAFVITK